MTEALLKKKVLILGGYGVFGGKLAETLLREPQFEVIVAGRSLQKARAFCAARGGTPVKLDRSAPDFTAQLTALDPFVTVDAAGPFQAYRDRPHAVAEAALQADSHYLDFSDDAAFTGGIGVLQEPALASQRAVLSGVSSVPALSSAAVELLKQDFARLDLIESAILPGNRAPRGLSVMRAILAQTGQPVEIRRDGAPATVYGWSGLARRRLGPRDKTGLPPRWTSFIGAPDLELFPQRYNARTVLFRAGLELPVMHLGLWCLSWLPRLQLMRSLEPSAKPLRKIADWLEPFGTDRGGMEVRLGGLNRNGTPLSRSWSLIAGAGDGPHVAAVAAAILCGRLASGTVRPGARACLGEFALDEVTEATRHLNITTFQQTDTEPTLFQRALRTEFDALPEPVRQLHTVFDHRRWSGKAKVTRGRSRLGNLLCRIVGFPPEAEETPVSVTIERRGDREIWRREFGGKPFKSMLSLPAATGTGLIRERFGLAAFDIRLALEDGSLTYPVRRGWFCGLPLPRWLLPVSKSREFAENGRFCFDVGISLPGAGALVRYQGWLEPDTAAGRDDAGFDTTGTL